MRFPGLPLYPDALIRDLAQKFGTPLFVYDDPTLREAARQMLSFPNPFGLTVRYAMKAAPNRALLELFDTCGLHFDASSGFEVERALRAGIAPEKIQLTAQELPGNLEALIRKGVLFNACSLRQLEVFGGLFPGQSLCIRVNPGLGSGHSNRTNVGGPSSSFGIWKDHLPTVLELLSRHRLSVKTVHSHIGSGTDAEVWKRAAVLTLKVVEQLPSVTVLNLGGGFKIARNPSEKSVDLMDCGRSVCKILEDFHKTTGRRLHLEVEPGTYLVALAGMIVARVQDKVDTGAEGFVFLKIDAGMTENARSALYGACHPLRLVPCGEASPSQMESVLVAGHCCENGDILTPAPGDPEGLAAVSLPRAAVGDLLVVGGAGAYGASMATKNYNSFPEAPEVLVDTDGHARLIRRRQTLDQMLENEFNLDPEN